MGLGQRRVCSTGEAGEGDPLGKGRRYMSNRQGLRGSVVQSILQSRSTTSRCQWVWVLQKHGLLGEVSDFGCHVSLAGFEKGQEERSRSMGKTHSILGRIREASRLGRVLIEGVCWRALIARRKMATAQPLSDWKLFSMSEMCLVYFPAQPSFTYRTETLQVHCLWAVCIQRPSWRIVSHSATSEAAMNIRSPLPVATANPCSCAHPSFCLFVIKWWGDHGRAAQIWVESQG